MSYRGYIDDDMDDQTIEVSMIGKCSISLSFIDTTSMYNSSIIKQPYFIKGLCKSIIITFLARVTNPRLGLDSEMVSPMNMFSPGQSQTPLRNTNKKESSFKAMYEGSKKNFDEDTLPERSPMTTTNKLSQMQYTFIRNKEEEKEKKISDGSLSDSEASFKNGSKCETFNAF